MLGFLTTQSRSPIMHLNTLFQDSWESVCKVKPAAVECMSLHEKADIRIKTAQRLKLDYLLQVSPYFECDEEDRSLVPSYCNSHSLKDTGPEAPPWEAVWHRTIRMLVCPLNRFMPLHTCIPTYTPAHPATITDPSPK